MQNLMSDSLNKKIFLITLLVLTFGLTFRLVSMDRSLPKSSAVQGMQTENVEFLTLEEGTSVKDIKFLSLDTYEQKLEQEYLEKEYINPDPNFETKVKNIETYMNARNAPLGKKAKYMVIMANKFSIDYRLVPAISIIESSGGAKLYRPYNAWGWGGAEGFTFEDWYDSIYTVSRGIARGYYARGATTPEAMAPTYNPHTPDEWGSKVSFTMNQIGPAL